MLLNLENLINQYDLKIKGVLHIGAHFGQEYSTYENMGIKNVVFFEPVPETFNRLLENIGDKAILVNTALGNYNGFVEMNIETANQGQSSSILNPKIHLEQYPHITFNNKIQVSMNKLDDYIENHSNYNFINIDVQGYELEVLKGGSEYLKNIDYIMTEVNRDEVYENCAKVDEIDKFLLEFGFDRVETNWAGGTWGDAFYIKKNNF
jgi:FkbM family methyltransferase